MKFSESYAHHQFLAVSGIFMFLRWCYDKQGNEPFHGHNSAPLLSQFLSCSDAEKVSGKIVWNITVSAGSTPLGHSPHPASQPRGIPAHTSVSLTQKSKKADGGTARFSHQLPSQHDGASTATFAWEMSFDDIVKSIPDEDWRETSFELESVPPKP
jgi:hypothetical protein